MTDKEKAKAYDEALDRMKYVVVVPKDEKALQVLKETIFPELRESEEGRIRKEIIEFIQWSEDRGMTRHDFHQAKRPSEWIAYLKKQKEQDGEDEEDNDFIIYHPLKNGKGEYECIPYSFYGSLTSFSEDKDLLDFLRTCFYTEEECNVWIEQQKEDEGYEAIPVESTLEYKLGFKTGKESEKQKEQKPLSTEETELNSIAFLEQLGYTCIPPGTKQEWTEEDKDNLNNIIWLCENCEKGIETTWTPSQATQIKNLIKSLLERFNLQPKQEWSEEDEKLFELLHQCVCRCINDDRLEYAEREKISKKIIPFIERLEK